MGFLSSIGRGILGVGTLGLSEAAGIFDDNTEKMKQGGYVDPSRQQNQTLIGDQQRKLTDQYQAGAANRAQNTQNQMQLAQQLQQQASGQGPSVSGMLLQQGADQNISQQFALANAMRGGTAGLRNRNAANNAAQIGQQAAGQAGVMRLQEQQQAQGQLAGLTGQMAQVNQNEVNQLNQLQQQYLNMGLGIDQAQFLANQQFEAARNGVALQDAARPGQFIGGLANAAGGIIGSAVGKK